MDMTYAEPTKEQTVIGLVMILILMIGSFFGGYFYGKHVIKKEAIEKNVAEYHPTTGEWQWSVK